jgi:hypothetical protein
MRAALIVVVTTVAVGAVLFAGELTLVRPPSSSRVAARILERLQTTGPVVSVVRGSRRRSVCRPNGVEGSLATYADGSRVDLADARFARLNFRRTADRALLVAGCPRLLAWLLYRRLYVQFVHGTPTALRQLARGGYRVALRSNPPVELEVDDALVPREVRVAGVVARLAPTR